MHIFKTVLALCYGKMVFGNASMINADDFLESGLQRLNIAASSSTLSHGLFDQARSLLASLKQSPSCVRQAAASLLNSCELIERKTDPQLKGRLERVKSTFAARIAICELLDASANVPQTCAAFIPTKDSIAFPNLGRSLRGESQNNAAAESQSLVIDESQLESCLHSLESRPQWWTSYSNGRQNALIMCQAVRSEADKDELLELHQWTMDVTHELHSALTDSLEESQHRALEQKEFFANLRKLQHDLMREFNRVDDYSQKLMSRTSASVDKLLQDLLQKITTSGEIIEGQALKTKEGLDRSSQQLDLLEKSTYKVFNGLVKGAAELASHHHSDWESSHKSALALQEILANLQEDYATRFLGSLDAMQQDILAASQAAVQLQRHQIQLDTRMTALNHAFSNIENRADMFQTTQQTQEQNQVRILESLRIDLTSAQSALLEMANSAQTLHSTVIDTSARFQSFNNNQFFWGIRNSISSYAFLAMGISLLGRANIGWLIPTIIMILWVGSDFKSTFSVLYEHMFLLFSIIFSRAQLAGLTIAFSSTLIFAFLILYRSLQRSRMKQEGKLPEA